MKRDISQLRSLPIEGVAERLGLSVRRHRSLCPFHDDSHPSMTYYVGRNTYKCFVCDAYGGVIDLAMKVLGKGFLETCQWLADAHNVIMTEYQPVRKIEMPVAVDIAHLARLVECPRLCKEAETFLFDERKINRAVVRWLGISSITQPMPMQGTISGSWFNAPSLLIPYRDMDGRLMSVQARYLGKEDNKPRFQFPRGSKCHVFNLPVLRMLGKDEPLYVTEGVSDCMAMLSAGHKAIAIPSATLLKTEDMKPIADMIGQGWKGSLHIYPDRDEAGERLYQNLLKTATQIGACLVRHELKEGCKDFGEMWKVEN